jgi:hypothetical protein
MLQWASPRSSIKAKRFLSVAETEILGLSGEVIALREALAQSADVNVTLEVLVEQLTELLARQKVCLDEKPPLTYARFQKNPEMQANLPHPSPNQNSTHSRSTSQRQSKTPNPK